METLAIFDTIQKQRHRTARKPETQGHKKRDDFVWIQSLRKKNFHHWCSCFNIFPKKNKKLFPSRVLNTCTFRDTCSRDQNRVLHTLCSLPKYAPCLYQINVVSCRTDKPSYSNFGLDNSKIKKQEWTQVVPIAILVAKKKTSVHHLSMHGMATSVSKPRTAATNWVSKQHPFTAKGQIK